MILFKSPVNYEWRKWFAWYPVKTETDQIWIWFEWVERKEFYCSLPGVFPSCWIIYQQIKK